MGSRRKIPESVRIEESKRMLKLKAQGLTYAVISRRFGYDAETVRKRVEALERTKEEQNESRDNGRRD